MKFVQITAVDGILYALDAGGTIWIRYHDTALGSFVWKRIEGPFS